jgi:sec-independent protein translocase protein TatC
MSAQADNHEPEEELAEGTLMSHLLELRMRLMKAVLAVIAVFVCLVPFTNDVFEFVSKPLREALPEGSQMIVTDVAAPFLTPFKTTFFVALFIAMPVVLFQIWQFVAPGLYKREKRLAIPLMASSIVLFYAGIAFAYFIVFRVMFTFFASVTPGGVEMTPDISAYLSFVLGIFLAFGVAFEVPIATVMLIWSGLVPVKALKGARPYVLLGAFVVGMVLTPPDVFSQTLLAVPMYLLYEVGLLMARFLIPDRFTVQSQPGA